MDELLPEDPRAMGPYRLVRRLGSGGMGQVFLGLSPGGRPVAVKVIRPELAADPGFRMRFGREVAAARAVGGMYTAPVADADPAAAVPWLATAYVPGPSLAEAVASGGPLPEPSLRALAAALAEGLRAIHATGLVHRDLKPTNVLLASDGPRIIDFGISRAAEASALTGTGLVVGSPGFMSPEQADGSDVGPASDIFSLGAVLVFAARGEGPFGTGSVPALLYRLVHSPPQVSGVPDRLRPLIARCLAKDPAGRPTAAQLLAELGTGQVGAGWLPAAFAQAQHRYHVPAAALAADPPPGPGGPAPGGPTVTGPARLPRAQPTEPPLPAGHLAQLAPASPPQRRDRSRLAWPLLAGAAAVAAIAATSIALTAARPHLAPPRQAAQLTAPGAVPSTAPAASPAVPDTASPATAAVSPSASPGSRAPGPGVVAGARAKVPQITRVTTYQHGHLVYFKLRYADPGHDAAGFGFAGTSGSGWARETHPFSSPSYGITGPGWIAYPFNLACGTAQQYQSQVRAWIYDTAGASSQPVTILLSCTAQQVPQISQATTYQQGQLVYFKLYYTDPGNNAEGFGFAGVNGSGWARETHPFTSPSYGIVGNGWIAYPFNLACGTAQQYQSQVQAWIYDTAGTSSQPVTIQLTCTS